MVFSFSKSGFGQNFEKYENVSKNWRFFHRENDLNYALDIVENDMLFFKLILH